MSARPVMFMVLASGGQTSGVSPSCSQRIVQEKAFEVTFLET